MIMYCCRRSKLCLVGQKGKIVSKDYDPHSHINEDENGRLFKRNRKYFVLSPDPDEPIKPPHDNVPRFSPSYSCTVVLL